MSQSPQNVINLQISLKSYLKNWQMWHLRDKTLVAMVGQSYLCDICFFLQFFHILLGFTHILKYLSWVYNILLFVCDLNPQSLSNIWGSPKDISNHNIVSFAKQHQNEVLDTNLWTPFPLVLPHPKHAALPHHRF